MKELIFSTGNSEKFFTAKQVCDQYDVLLTQKNIDITEIQEEDPEKVARDKAAKAFEAVKQPLVITDDSWSFLGLNGFPGVYMHSMNEWLTAEDFLRLVLPLKDRRAVLTQYLIYTDGRKQKVFTKQIEGTLLKEVRGSSKYPNHMIISLSGDDGLSIAEAYDQTSDRSTRTAALVWHEFAKWFSKNYKTNSSWLSRLLKALPR